MRRHDRAGTGGDRRAERLECLAQVAADDRQLEVRVLRGVAVAGKMLRARGDSLTLKARHERRDLTSNERGLRAERANPDHGVGGIRVDVRDRCEVEVDPDRSQLAGDRGSDLLCQRCVVNDAEGPVSRVRASRSRLEASDIASLLIRRDEQIAVLGAQRPRQ
jgi:hypothetical protein